MEFGFNYDIVGDIPFLSYLTLPIDFIIICFVYIYWIGNGNYGVVLLLKEEEKKGVSQLGHHIHSFKLLGHWLETLASPLKMAC